MPEDVHRIFLGNIKGPSGTPLIATYDSVGVVRPDSTSFSITEDGTLSISSESYMTSEQIDQSIKEAVIGLYRIKGSIDFSDLPDPTEESLGDVYNVNDKFVSDERFTVPDEKFGPGTNIVVVEDSESGGYKYDALTGMNDLTDYVTFEEMDEKIAESIASLYKIQGSCTFEGLPTPDKEHLGFVYNVTESFTTDDRFINEGEAHVAGTNVVVVNHDDGYKYDVLTGFYEPVTEEVDGLMSAEDKKVFDVITGGESSSLVLADGTVMDIVEIFNRYSGALREAIGMVSTESEGLIPRLPDEYEEEDEEV